MKKIFVNVLLFLVGCLLPLSVQAGEILYVPGQFDTIQAAVTAAQSGDIIELASLTFPEHDILISGKTLEIRSASNNPDYCIIDCDYAGRAFRVEYVPAGGFTLKGIKVVHGKISIPVGGDADGGGAIKSLSSTLILDNCIFSYNSVVMANAGESFRAKGGAVYVSGGSITSAGCTFTYNGAVRGYGGAVSVEQGYPSSFTDCIFENNRMSSSSATVNGGALYSDRTSMGLNNCTFENNYSLVKGGGIFLNYAVLEIAGGRFSFNRAGETGGAIECTSARLRIKDRQGERVSFNDNQAAVGGGAINLGGVELDLQKCDFVRNILDNTDSAGGGVFVAISGLLKMSDCLFDGNRAETGGGVDFAVSGEVEFEDCIFKGNGLVNGTSNADSLGGGVNVYVNGETELLIDRCEFKDNEAYYGGGMYFKTGTTSGSYYNIEAVVANTLFNGNRAYEGGGLNIPEFAPAYLRNCTFADNSAVSAGGGLWCNLGRDMNFSTLEMINSILWDNRVDSGAQEDGPQLQVLPLPTDSNPDVRRAVITYSDIQDGYDTGQDVISDHNIDFDPLFHDFNSDDFRLDAGSPCIDSASDVFKYVPGSDPDRDLDNRDRPNGAYDMGAYEARPPLLINSISSVSDDEPGLLKGYTMTCEAYSQDGISLDFAFNFADDYVEHVNGTSLGNNLFIATSSVHVYTKPGTYPGLCKVSDGKVDPVTSDPTLITVENLPPVADAGMEQVIVTTIATLNGGASTDPDGKPGESLNYSWSLLFKDLNGVRDPDKDKTASGVNPNIAGLEKGYYDVTLTVTDAHNAGTDTTRLSVAAEKSYTEGYGEGYNSGKADGLVEGAALTKNDTCAGAIEDENGLPYDPEVGGDKYIEGPVIINGGPLIIIKEVAD